MASSVAPLGLCARRAMRLTHRIPFRLILRRSLFSREEKDELRKINQEGKKRAAQHGFDDAKTHPYWTGKSMPPENRPFFQDAYMDDVDTAQDDLDNLDEVAGEFDDEFLAKIGKVNRPDNTTQWGPEKRDAVMDLVVENMKGLPSQPIMGSRQALRNMWNEDEPDEDLIDLTDPAEEDEFDEDDILTGAHHQLEQHREYRHYMRLAAWELPLLSKLAKAYEPPKNGQILRFRHTTYMGEYHPAEKKVVVTFCPHDLGLTPQQTLKLIKLAGVRYNPFKNIIKMSCEAYDHPAQNKRRLGDLVNKLVEEAKNPADTFEDIPLDFRHAHDIHKRVTMFPTHWRMTPERKQELAGIRKEAQLLQKQQEEEGTFIDGNNIVRRSFHVGKETVFLATAGLPRPKDDPSQQQTQQQQIQQQQTQQLADMYREMQAQEVQLPLRPQRPRRSTTRRIL